MGMREGPRGKGEGEGGGGEACGTRGKVKDKLMKRAMLRRKRER